MAESLEAQLQATLNMIPAYTWYATRSGGLIFVNERAADYGGLPNDHPLRHGMDTSAAWDSHIAVLHPEDQEETRRVWSECLRTGRPGEVSFRARNAAGGYRWFLSRAEPLRSNDGTILYWIGINLDIEERKQAEVELRRSKEYLADAERLSRTGFVAMDGGTKRLFWSEEAARIYGYPPGTEPTPDLILQRSHPDDVGLVKDALERAAADGSDFDYEHRLLMPDGSTKHLHDIAHRVRDDAGNDEVIGAIIDITERKLAEEQIRQQEMEFRQILDATPHVIAVYGPNRERLYINRIALDYLGLAGQEWQQTLERFTFVHPDDRARERDYFDRARSTGSACENELRLRKGDGSYRWFLARYNPVVDAKGHVARWYVACADIDDRKRD